MEEVKIVVRDDGRLMAELPDGTLVPLRAYSNTGVFIDLIPNKQETNYA
jgi:hypothetical protein